MYQLNPLHSYDYLQKISVKLNMATDKDNSQNEMWHRANDEIGVAVQSWLQTYALSVRASEWNSVVVDSNPTQTNFL